MEVTLFGELGEWRQAPLAKPLPTVEAEWPLARPRAPLRDDLVDAVAMAPLTQLTLDEATCGCGLETVQAVVAGIVWVRFKMTRGHRLLDKEWKRSWGTITFGCVGEGRARQSQVKRLAESRWYQQL